MGLGQSLGRRTPITMNDLLAESESLAVFAPSLLTKSLQNLLGIIVCKECLSRPFANKTCKKKPEESGEKTRELEYLTFTLPILVTHNAWQITQIILFL